MPDPIARAIQRAPYEHPPVYVHPGGYRYVEPRELVRSAAFWRVVARMRGFPGADERLTSHLPPRRYERSR